MFGVDYKSKLDSSAGKDVGRESVRLEGKKEYNKGLFVLDIKHMPGGICGTWPAFWSLGREPWPVKGEIDIIEGVNRNTANQFVLHTDTNCKVDGLGQTGTQVTYDCALDGSSGSSGCNVNDANTASYGTGFNANQGGYYVTEWQADGIKIWFFPRGSAPKSLQTSEPDTAEFGTPNANFKGACDIEKRFMDQRFIFTNTFCGDWAGNVYASSGCPMYPGLGGMDSCKKYVAENPQVFKDAYWRVSSFKTYNKRAVVSSSSVAPSSTSHAASSSSVHVSSSSTHVSSSSAYVSSSSALVSSSSAPVSSSSTHVSSSYTHVSSSSTPLSSSSAHVSSSSTHVSSSSTHASSSSTPVSSSSAHVSSRSALVSSSSTQASSSSTQVSSSSAHVSSSSAQVLSTSTHVSSSSIHISSSSVAHSSSAQSSSIVQSSSTPTPHASSSVYPSTTPAASSSYPNDVSSSVMQGTSSVYSPSASETPSDTSSSVYSPSASETPYSHQTSSSVYSASASDTPYQSDSSSAYPSASSSYPVSSDVSSVYPSETPYSSSVYPSGASLSAYPDASSYPVVSSSSTASVYPDSTPVPVYSVYPESDGYEHSGVSSRTVDASSKASEYPVASSKYPDVSSKVPGYGNGYPVAPSTASDHGAYPVMSTKTSEYDSYPEASSSAPVYGNEYSTATPSVQSTPVYANYPDLPSFTPVYSTYPAVSSKPSDSYKTTTAYETTYVDVCPTGYTTITTKVTAIQTPAPYPTDAYYAPPGFEVTTKYCAQGCGEGPKTVTVTVPCSKCQAPTPVPNKSTGNTPYTPGQPSKPSVLQDSTTKATATTIVTLTKIPVPETQYSATHPSIPSASASMIKYPDSASSKSNANPKPLAPTGYIAGNNSFPTGAYPTGGAPAPKPLTPSVSTGGAKPVYPVIAGSPGSNVTVAYGTATGVESKPTQMAYAVPEFTGAASGVRVGGVVAGALAVVAVFVL